MKPGGDRIKTTIPSDWSHSTINAPACRGPNFASFQAVEVHPGSVSAGCSFWARKPASDREAARDQRPLQVVPQAAGARRRAKCFSSSSLKPEVCPAPSFDPLQGLVFDVEPGGCKEHALCPLVARTGPSGLGKWPARGAGISGHHGAIRLNVLTWVAKAPQGGPAPGHRETGGGLLARLGPFLPSRALSSKAAVSSHADIKAAGAAVQVEGRMSQPGARRVPAESGSGS